MLSDEPDTRDTVDIIRERKATCGRGIDIVITNAIPIPGLEYRWRYSACAVRPLREGRFTKVPPDQNPWVGDAYNTFEAINDCEDRCVQGSGDKTEGLPQGLDLQPIGIGAVVLDAQLVDTADGKAVALFHLPNNVDGKCVTS